MNIVTLITDGSIVHNGNIVETNALMFLSFEVELEEGYTLRSYFQMLEIYILFANMNAFFPTYMEQYRTSPPNGCFLEGIDHLELRKTVEMIGFPGEPRLEIYNSFHGVYGRETCEIRFFQLENLLDMKIKLGRLKHIVFGDKVDVFEFETVFSLFEFIEAIAWELSFHGTSSQCEIRR